MKSHDIIIVLDAMRWDTHDLLEKSPIVGDVKKINTDCCTTQAWYNKYWASRHDRILITENPMPYHRGTNKCKNNFEMAYTSFGDTWLNIDPQNTINIFKRVKHPNKKYLIHFLPPHLPYVYGDGVMLMGNTTTMNIYEQTQQWGQKHGFDKLRQYYREQISGVLDLLYNNMHLFDGYSMCITADHGEIIGYDEMYAHPPSNNLAHRNILTNVPFMSVDVTETLVDKRLKMLGYINE